MSSCPAKPEQALSKPQQVQEEVTLKQGFDFPKPGRNFQDLQSRAYYSAMRLEAMSTFLCPSWLHYNVCMWFLVTVGTKAALSGKFNL